MTRVEVIWDDALAKLEEITLAEARKVEPIRTHSVGWLVEQNDSVVIIAVDRWPSHADVAGSYHVIPRGMVLEVVELAPLDKSDYAESLGIGA